MPYSTREQLPESVRSALARVPHALDIYRETFNSALDQYGSEARAHKVAWGAVKKKYEKGANGKWHRRD